MRNFPKIVFLVAFTLMGLVAMAASDTQAPIADYNNPKMYKIDQIHVHGVEFMNKNVLISNTGLVRGDSILVPGTQLTQAVEKLWDQKYFSDVSIETAIKSGDRMDVNIYLTELPRVFNWKFEGISKSHANNLTEDLQLKRGQSEYSEFVVNRNINKIKKYFSDKGFLNVDVATKVENDSVLLNSVNVTFVVDRKNRVKIGEIQIEGNEAVKDSKVVNSMKTLHAKNWKFWQNTKFKQSELDVAKENIIDFYNSRGYKNAVIVQDSIYDINHKRMGIKLTVEEGDRFYYRNVDWVGNSKYDSERLNRMLNIRPGDVYDNKSLNKILGVGKDASPDDMSISSLYQNDGYLFFQLMPSEEVVGKDSIDLTLKIIEGKQATINEVSISGNLRLNEEVIRRELSTRPGELYNRALLMQTLRQLSTMGHFNPETLQPDIEPISSELVNISFPLQEQASDKLELSAGWGSGMFVGSVGVQLNNISLKEFFKKNAWRPYPQGQNQQLSISVQTNGTYYKSFSLGFTDPWVGGRKPNSLTVSAHYSEENDAYYAWESSDSYFRSYGVAVGLGRRLSWPDRYFSIYNELAYQCYNLVDWDYFLMDNGTSNVISLKTVLSRSSVDQNIYPRTGSNFSASLTLTPPYSLFDGKDYASDDLSDEERYKWIEFHKWEFKADWFTPLSKDNKLVMKLGMEMGVLGSYNGDKLSPFEGFDVGGDGMTTYSMYGVDIIGLRGYSNSSLTPSSDDGDYARVYNKYVLEMRYPIVLDPTSTIYVLGFAEAGNAFASWSEFDPFVLKRSLGVGVRLYLPIVGMVGLDWGWGFDKDVSTGSTSGSQFHFTMGTSF